VNNQLVTQFAIYAVVAGLMIFRYSRPQKMSLTRMWIAPIFFTAMTAFAIWGAQQTNPAPVWAIAVAVIGGLILGAPLGLLRGKHTNVRATDQPGVMYLDASWIVLAIWLGAFVLRAVVRALIPHGTTATIVGDGLIVFAIATVVVSYYEIYHKYRALEHAAGQI
jgi:membrane protein CcdC involved in cytochrome C biogenesis